MLRPLLPNLRCFFSIYWASPRDVLSIATHRRGFEEDEKGQDTVYESKYGGAPIVGVADTTVSECQRESSSLYFMEPDRLGKGRNAANPLKP
ncbi:hypothetical protein COLO4_01814 [Corchorus olitorius]|uniref:Uncharacterized protein n=1 Tax=Corchorus olitorius TaxID=93759 RepID=A0A1R3L244_9ROSI|nr:hypothetical protein COLO4_01814 [Corchorus olitorius]